MTFQHLGRILTLCEYLRFMVYDENCELATTEDELYSSFGNKRKFKQDEMDFHEKLFLLLSTEDVLDSEHIYQVLRILMHPRKMKINDYVSCVYNYCLEYLKVDNYDDCKEVIRLFRKLDENRLYFVQIGYFKPKKFQILKEIKEKQETYQPLVTKESRELAAQNTQKFLQEYDQFVSRYESNEKSQMKSEYSSKSQSQVLKKIDLLYKRKELKEYKNYNARLLKEEEVKTYLFRK